MGSDHMEEDFFARLQGWFPPHGFPFLENEEVTEGERRNLALVLAYDGGGFAGWQLQPGNRTLQGVVEKILSLLCDEPIRVEASGRTDAGVHAWGQVAGFSTKSSLSLPRMLAGLRSLLPPEIHVRRLGAVDEDFHARFDAQAKTYDYFLWPKAKASLFLRHRLWAVAHPLEEEPVRRALDVFTGEHDLKALAFRGNQVEGSTIRRVLKTSLLPEPSGVWRIRITATGFLRHVIRNLVGVLVQVGGGRLSVNDFSEMLAAGQRIYSGPKAPPGGLYLNRVYYDDDVKNLNKENKP